MRLAVDSALIIRFEGLFMVKKFLAIAILAFTCVNWAGSAQADQVFRITQVNWNPTIKGTITDANGTTNVNITGGGVFGATLDGIPLAATYCLDIRNDIYGWTNYTSIVNQTGHVYGNSNPEINAGAIGWLVANVGLEYAPGSPYQAATAGLQALIWELVSPNTYSPQGLQTFHFVAASNSQAVVNGYNYALGKLNAAAGGSNNYASLDAWKTAVSWITPYPGLHGSLYAQAQVGAMPGAHPNVAVPEPSSLALLCLGGIGSAVGALRRRRQQNA